MGVDWDDVLGYSTTRLVKIRDRRLGILYYTCLFLIFCYIVGYVLLYNQGYKATAPLVGTVRLQLQRPEPPFRLNSSALQYCGDGTYAPDGIAYPRLQCRFLDQYERQCPRMYDAVYPALESAASLLTTRAIETLQQLPDGCGNCAKAGCSYANKSSTSYYVGDVEFFTLLVDHTMTVPEIGISRGATGMVGEILDQDGNIMDPCDDYYAMGWECPPYIHVHSKGHRDIVAVKTLMRAAGISSLDLPLGDTSPPQSLRYSGYITLIEIDYTNFGSLGTEDVTYTYRVSKVKDTEFKAEEVMPGRGSLQHNRTLLDRHGLRFVVKQEGTVGAFSFQTLLIQLVSSMGLMAVATFTVDAILQYILPLRYIYRQYKTVKSIDFSDLTEADRKLFEKADLVNPLPRLPDEALERLRMRQERLSRASRDDSQGNPLSRRLLDGRTDSYDTPNRGFSDDEYDTDD